MISSSVNLCSAPIASNMISGSMEPIVSFQASPIAVNIFNMLSPTFLNDSMISHLPSISSMFSSNSFIGIPNFSETFFNSLTASICFLV
mgnify:CR=1 FL=1